VGFLAIFVSYQLDEIKISKWSDASRSIVGAAGLRAQRWHFWQQVIFQTYP
jgi:hypothetical protein